MVKEETENPDLPTVAERRWEGWHDYKKQKPDKQLMLF